MQITQGVLRALGQGFQAAFLQGIESVKPQWPLVAMEVQSTAKIENYGWMRDLPGMREWVGDRVIHNLEATNYQLINKNWEHTIGVDRNDIEDDQLGLYRNRFAMQGEVAAQHGDTLVWSSLLLGNSTIGLDGQYFFDTDHVGYDAAGVEAVYSNYAAGAAAPWFLMDLSRTYMKPLVMQKRQDVKFVNLDRETDDNVFLKRQFMYGADARYNVGFGFHQLAYMGKTALDVAAYAAARVAIGTQRKPDGSSMNVMPTHLLVGPSNEAAARQLIRLENIGGTTNPWYNSVELVIVPALG
ncbi:Mu-like prophage major head subunit gpT family protein [Methylobacter sp. S3L5C]|uniref:Mu-like prophage major head subunit gpT family protein n=1 Tax=Methylobacter sp. S3L5C TaxID=2839024 RepID=UPI001FAC030D|nr:Mu-like prophage major head subunit gpT family protein [Methylobacter sp. S3L5C]UOA07626.1 Mu-like prophage major head subunit gpT family protein [Methylobacter sp. S3L5C]